MNILGIHVGHDSSACLVRDGEIVADVAEERFSRVKHSAGLPLSALAYCLESQKLTMKDIDVVAVPTSGCLPPLNFLLDLKGDREEKRSVMGRAEDTVRNVFKRGRRQ